MSKLRKRGFTRAIKRSKKQKFTIRNWCTKSKKQRKRWKIRKRRP